MYTFEPGTLQCSCMSVINCQVDEFHVNDKVRVMKDKELVKKLQAGHGEWANEMTVVSNVICVLENSDNKPTTCYGVFVFGW